MRYIQMPDSVYGYESWQADLAEAALARGGAEITGTWPTAPSPEELRQRDEQEAIAQKRAALRELDLQSIRALREYVAAQQDAPKELKVIEAAAIAARKP